MPLRKRRVEFGLIPMPITFGNLLAPPLLFLQQIHQSSMSSIEYLRRDRTTDRLQTANTRTCLPFTLRGTDMWWARLIWEYDEPLMAFEF